MSAQQNALGARASAGPGQYGVGGGQRAGMQQQQQQARPGGGVVGQAAGMPSAGGFAAARGPGAVAASGSGVAGRPGGGGQFAAGGGTGQVLSGESLFAQHASAAANAPPPGLGASAAAGGGGVAGLSAPPGLLARAAAERDDAGAAGGGAGGGAPAASSLPSVPPEAYGMAGLLSVLKAGDRDIPALALGTDLSAPGINLSAPSTSSHPLHALFASPWAKEVTQLEPHWVLPGCYRMPQPALKTGHFAKFDVTTLLYIFYAMPRDILQAYAAQELYAREWRYHRDLKLWFKGEGAGKGPTSAVTWSYFDLPSWERKAYTGPAGTLTAGFLSEEDTRVKPQQAVQGQGQAGQGGQQGGPA